jgi:hypothetical protein
MNVFKAKKQFKKIKKTCIIFDFIIFLISKSQSNQRIIIYFIHIANFLNFKLEI